MPERQVEKKDERFDVETHFAFGQNWEEYARHINEGKIRTAGENLERLLRGAIRGKTFLDIGCGSGVHALAALKAGAALVDCIDFDPDSVKTTRAVLAKFWEGENCRVEQANILDSETLGHLPTERYDIVYSWGVLHHTGDMFQAINRAATFVKPGGLLVLALYKETTLCGFWKREKAFYKSASKILRKLCDYVYSGLYLTGLLATGRNPVKYVKEYEKNRGMRFMNDVSDWLGGFPYESIAPEDVKVFIETKGFRLNDSYNTAPVAAGGLFGSGCAEYVFQRIG